MQTLQSVNAGNVSLAAVVNGFLVDCGFILLIFFSSLLIIFFRNKHSGHSVLNIITSILTVVCACVFLMRNC